MRQVFLFDWGNTIMKDFPNEKGPMYLWSKVEIIPNAKEMLSELSLYSDCYIATNAKDSKKSEIYKALQRVGLDRFFKDIFCFEETGYLKPSKEFYNYIVNKLGVDKNLITMVGDNYETDYLGAQKSGISALLYTPLENCIHGDIKSVSNLSMIIDYLGLKNKWGG